MAPVLMVEVERDQITLGLEFFCAAFDGDNPLSPCGIPYLFVTLYQNQLTPVDHSKIIEDINHHISSTPLVCSQGLKNVDTLVTLQQNIKIRLRKLLLSIKGPSSSNILSFKSRRSLTQVLFSAPSTPPIVT